MHINATDVIVQTLSKIIKHIEDEPDGYEFDSFIKIENSTASGDIQTRRVFSKTFDKCTFTLENFSSGYFHSLIATIHPINSAEGVHDSKIDLHFSICGSENIEKSHLIKRIHSLQDYYKRKREDNENISKLNSFSEALKSYGLEMFVQ